jgi:hypothetical protein
MHPLADTPGRSQVASACFVGPASAQVLKRWMGVLCLYCSGWVHWPPGMLPRTVRVWPTYAENHLCASPLPIPSSHVFMTMGCWLAGEREEFLFHYLRITLLFLSLCHTLSEGEKIKQNNQSSFIKCKVSNKTKCRQCDCNQ